MKLGGREGRHEKRGHTSDGGIFGEGTEELPDFLRDGANNRRPEKKTQPETKRAQAEDETRAFSPVKQPEAKKAPTGDADSSRSPAEQREARLSRDYAAPAPIPERKKHSRAGKLIICVLVIAALCTAAYAIWETPPERKGEAPKVQTTQSVETPAANTAEPEKTGEGDAEPSKKTGRRSDCYTFLLTALDQVGANTDTIIVGRLDTGNGTLSLVNIPRDTLVNVSWGVKKVNTVLIAEDNDPEKFIDKLSDILGFDIDCYAVVNIKAVEELVDCIGGVDYDVPRSMDYDDPSQDFYVHIPAGYQHLNGEDTVKVLRFRMGNDGTGYANGDLGRIATQQDFLMSIASQTLTLGNIPNLAKAIDIFEKYVDTDLTSGNLAYFARQFLLLDKKNLSFHTLPGSAISIRGGSYYEIELDGWIDMLNEYLNPYYEDISKDNLSILQYDSANGVYATSGSVAGGTDSFFDFSTYR